MAYEFIPQVKSIRANGATTAWTASYEYSLWEHDGIPSAGAQPTTWAKPTNATAGGMQQTNPAGGLQKWLTGLTATSFVPGRLTLYDRLLHIGGLSGTSTSVQNVNGGAVAAVDRYTDGLGNRIFTEIYSALGTTPAVTSVIYTDAAGSPATATGGIGGSTWPYQRVVQSCQRVTQPPGNKGVKGITSIQLNVSTLTAGNFGIVVAHDLATFEIPAVGQACIMSFLDANVEILTNACLAWTFQPYNTIPATSLVMTAFADFVDK